MSELIAPMFTFKYMRAYVHRRS